MTDIDTSILDELRNRQRRAALRQRGAATGRVKPKRGRTRRAPRTPKVKGPDMRNTPEAKARAKESIAARRKREGDEMCAAVLAVLQRLAS